MTDVAVLFGVDAAELRARLRSMRLAARVLCGDRARALEAALHRAERDAAALVDVVVGIKALAPLDRRRVLAYEHVLQTWTKEPKRFRLNPSHHIPGPYT